MGIGGIGRRELRAVDRSHLAEGEGSADGGAEPVDRGSGSVEVELFGHADDVGETFGAASSCPVPVRQGVGESHTTTRPHAGGGKFAAVDELHDRRSAGAQQVGDLAGCQLRWQHGQVDGLPAIDHIQQTEQNACQVRRQLVSRLADDEMNPLASLDELEGVVDEPWQSLGCVDFGHGADDRT